MSKTEIYYDAILKDWTIKTYIDGVFKCACSIGEGKGMDFIHLLTNSLIEIRNYEKSIIENTNVS